MARTRMIKMKVQLEQHKKLELMKKYFSIAILFFVGCSFLLVACSPSRNNENEELARIAVSPTEGAGITPVAIPLDGVIFNTDNGRLALFDASNPDREIPSQLEPGTIPKLWFMADHGGEALELVLRQVTNEQEHEKEQKLDAAARFETTNQVTTILMHGKPVLSYYHAEAEVPQGVDPVFSRSAFIHPLWSPGGEVLTRIQPDDHYHHYGIWNPWTSTTVEGVGDIDFWNLGSRQGRVRFGGYLAKEGGPVYAGIKVRQEHIAYTGIDREDELLAINELWDVRAWDTGLDDITIVDLSTTLNAALPGGIMLNQYRYGGGLGFRATQRWGRDNATVLTSEGKERDETDATMARWCIIEGESDVIQGRSGVLFLSHPSNRMHPEPMRMWDSNSHDGIGNIFFEFTPIRHEGWELEPDRSYTLKYRMIVFDGEMTAEEAERHWKAFAKAPGVSID